MDRTKKFRTLAATVVVAVSGLALVACAGGPSGEATDSADATGDIRFSWWGSPSRNEHTQAVIDAFVADRDVKVQGEPADFPSYFERLNVQAASRDMPCVAQMLTYALGDYAGNDLLLDTAQLEQIDLASLDADVVDSLTTSEGAVYMVPYGLAPSSIVYNVTMAQENGITPPAGEQTWTDYFEWLEDAQSNLPDGTYAVEYPYDNPVGVMTYLAAQGEVFDDGTPVFDVDDLAQWFTEWKRLQDEGVMLPGTRIGDYTGRGHEASALANSVVLASEKAANAFVAISDGLAANGKPSELGYFLLPTADDGQATDLVPINGLTIPKNCEHPGTAAEFINFWVNDEEAIRAFAANNGAPTAEKFRAMLLDDPETDDSTRYTIEVAQNVVERGSGTFDLPPGFQAGFQDAYKRLSISVLAGVTTPEDAAEQLFDVLKSGS